MKEKSIVSTNNNFGKGILYSMENTCGYNFFTARIIVAVIAAVTSITIFSMLKGWFDVPENFILTYTPLLEVGLMLNIITFLGLVSSMAQVYVSKINLERSIVMYKDMFDDEMSFSDAWNLLSKDISRIRFAVPAAIIIGITESTVMTYVPTLVKAVFAIMFTLMCMIITWLSMPSSTEILHNAFKIILANKRNEFDSLCECNIIVARNKNGYIGYKGDLLYKGLSKDMRFFKDSTNGGIVIMGRKTYESIGRALPNRINIVISRKEKYDICVHNVYSATSMIDALATAYTLKTIRYKNTPIWIIGGSRVYKRALPFTKKIHATLIMDDTEGDVSFEIPDNIFNHEETSDLIIDNDYETYRQIFVRKEGV